MDEQRRRQAENELLFRGINEEIEEVAVGPLGGGQETGRRPIDFVCECKDKGCTVRLALTVPEYEAVRDRGDRFLVAPSPEHVDTGIERVVDMSSRYWVVEKIDEAGEFASDQNPRD